MNIIYFLVSFTFFYSKYNYYCYEVLDLKPVRYYDGKIWRIHHPKPRKMYRRKNITLDLDLSGVNTVEEHKNTKVHIINPVHKDSSKNSNTENDSSETENIDNDTTETTDTENSIVETKNIDSENTKTKSAGKAIMESSGNSITSKPKKPINVKIKKAIKTKNTKKNTTKIKKPSLKTRNKTKFKKNTTKNLKEHTIKCNHICNIKKHKRKRIPQKKCLIKATKKAFVRNKPTVAKTTKKITVITTKKSPTTTSKNSSTITTTKSPALTSKKSAARTTKKSVVKTTKKVAATTKNMKSLLLNNRMRVSDTTVTKPDKEKICANDSDTCKSIVKYLINALKTLEAKQLSHTCTIHTTPSSRRLPSRFRISNPKRSTDGIEDIIALLMDGVGHIDNTSKNENKDKENKKSWLQLNTTEISMSKENTGSKAVKNSIKNNLKHSGDINGLFDEIRLRNAESVKDSFQQKEASLENDDFFDLEGVEELIDIRDAVQDKNKTFNLEGLKNKAFLNNLYEATIIRNDTDSSKYDYVMLDLSAIKELLKNNEEHDLNNKFVPSEVRALETLTMNNKNDTNDTVMSTNEDTEKNTEDHSHLTTGEDENGNSGEETEVAEIELQIDNAESENKVTIENEDSMEVNFKYALDDTDIKVIDSKVKPEINVKVGLLPSNMRFRLLSSGKLKSLGNIITS